MAAVEYYLKIEGVQAASTSQKHKGEIEVLSWSWGEVQTGFQGGSGGGGAGKVQISPLHVVARSSLASPKLFLACASGKHFPKAVLTAVRQVKGKNRDYLIWTFSDVFVTSYQIGAENQDAQPVDAFELSFDKIEVEYKPIKADGSFGSSVIAGWDIKSNKGV